MEDFDYSESLLNMVLDEIDDIILIHDSKHTVVWMNRAGLKAFDVNLEDVIGKACYKLFGKNDSCEDCDMSTLYGSKCRRTKAIPGREGRYICKSLPMYRDGEIVLVVQHLSRAADPANP